VAVDFDIVKDTVRTVALRLDSPASKYNFIFSESDTAVEICVEDSNATSPLFVFVVDEERFRVIKALDLDPDGYASFPYHSYVELLSFIIENFYPVFFKLTSNGLVIDMLSRILGKRIRVWKDLLRVICEAGQVEFVDRGKVCKVLGTNFWYNSGDHVLFVSGELNDSYKCPTVMELVITLLTILAYIFQLNDLDANPILGVQEVEEGSNSLFEEEMDMGKDIDSMDMEGAFAGGDSGAGEDLSAEFAPAGDSIENTAPEISEGKEEIMDEINAAVYRVPKGFKSIFSNVDKGTATQVNSASSVSSYTPLYSRSRDAIFSSPDRDYVDATGELRTWLDGICKAVKDTLLSQGRAQVGVSPITNLTWRVTVGQEVYFEITVSSLDKGDYSLGYKYKSSRGVISGTFYNKGDLKSLISLVGV